jgi:hypothetical protein
MAKRSKANGKSKKALTDDDSNFSPKRGGFFPEPGFVPGRKTGGYRGKNTPANWRRFNP